MSLADREDRYREVELDYIYITDLHDENYPAKRHEGSRKRVASVLHGTHYILLIPDIKSCAVTTDNTLKNTE